MSLLEIILDKPELRGINKDFANSILQTYLNDRPKIREEYEKDPERFMRKKAFQKLRSDVRQKLREVYGVFFTGKYGAKTDKALAKLREEKTEEALKELLLLHRSTQERIPYYPVLYPQLFSEAKSILDLGCGFNPYAQYYLPKQVAYHSADIACEDLKRIGEYFDDLGITHSEHCIDLTDMKNVKELPKVDVAIAFKLLDSLETRKWNVSKELLETVPAKKLIVSFPTLSIGQKTPIGPREWFEKIIADKEYSTVTLPNEQFYIITLER